MSKVCNQCGNKYQRIGTHWSQSSSCEHKRFTQHQREMITGILMGDGWIEDSSKNPLLKICMISPNYLSHVANKFGVLGSDVKLRKTASESAENNRKSGFSENAKAKNYSDVYRWRSIRHPDLQEFAGWYDSGEKVWPENIELTPTVLKHWYCGDGCWNTSRNNNYIQISMANEIDETEKVSNIFERVGLPSPSNYCTTKRKDGRKRCDANFTVEDSKELWDYMSEPLPDFEYKWPDRYC